MNELHATCPGCGKPVVFQGSFSLSSICDACGTIVVRPDFGHNAGGTPTPRENLATNGTIVAPIENDSPLELGMKGYYQGHPFEIRGVVRLEHDAGGFWDEWYLLFDDGRWGWLAEAQRHFYLTFAVELKQAVKVPSFQEIRLEQRFLLRAGDPPMLVAEKGYGSPLGARGEIPYALAPQTVYQYADLSGPAGRFATIDYGDTPPSLYFGREVALGDLHLPHKPEDLAHEPRQVEAVNGVCPNCHGSLTLRVPHKTVRVGCTACGALLDAAEGRLQLAHKIANVPKPPVPIGAMGQLYGVQYTVVGYLQRCLKSETSETWDEYLLYNSQVGYRWLTSSDDHWHFVETVPPGNVELQGKNASCEGKLFRWSEQDIALVECVLGEFYWKVDPGEQVWMTDYVRPPEMLSREITHGGPDSGEISWSRGIYVPVPTIEQAFGLQHALPRPSYAAASQPFSYGRLCAWWAVMVGLTILLGLFFQSHHRYQQVFHKTYLLPAVRPDITGATPGKPAVPQAGQARAPGTPGRPDVRPDLTGATPGKPAVPQAGQAEKPDVQPNVSGGTTAGGDEGQIFFSDPFEVRDHENIQIRVRASGANFWLGVDGDLVDEQSGVVQEFSLPVEYYEGVSEGESWSEGSREASAFLSALPAGQYTLRIVGQHEPQNIPLSFEVSVYENVARTAHFLLALAGVSLLPVIVLVLHGIAYSRRRNQ